MPRRDLLDLDATAQLAALAAKQVSAVELLKAALARHEETHTALNAIVAADLPRAMERATAIDERRVKGEPLGLLAGLPMTVKDVFDVAGMPASAGLASLRRRTSTDATVVVHARQAGAVVWGKSNVPVMAADFQTYNALYGTTNNPWDVARTSGGSSGGAAAAVAARVTALEIGADIGGSLRGPASFCGVFTHKPTWGLVSQYGHVPPRPGSWSERDLNVVGPMARSARDLRLLLSVIEDGPMAPRAPAANLAGLRVGLWLEAPGFPLDPQVRAVVEALAKDLAAAGAVVEPIASPVEAEALLEAYVTLLGSTLAEDMPEKLLRRMRWARAFGGLTRSPGPFSRLATMRAMTATHLEWIAADAVRMRLRHAMEGVFERFDVILAPAMPVAAFPHDHRKRWSRKLVLSDGSTAPYQAMLAWMALATACHLPATVVPAGLTAAGLPVGVQLIGPRGGDSKTLAVAQAIDENIRGFVAPP